MAGPIVLLSIPQLRTRDVAPGGLASLDAIVGRGAEAELEPGFPGLAGSSFATIVTGEPPSRHGLIGNTYYDRASRKVVPAPLPDSAVTVPRLWERFKAARPGSKTMLWFAPNSCGAAVDLAAWVDKSWALDTEPAGLRDQLIAVSGPFPRPEAGSQGEPPRLEATAWILKTAAATLRAHRPDLAILRVPYLGQIARRYGPDGREAGRAVRELEGVLAPFLKAVPPGSTIIAATETVVTPVSGPAFPNRVLRSLGLLAVRPAEGGGVDCDLDRSAAFALVDHQIAHVYLNDPSQAATVASAFAGEFGDGVATVAPGEKRADLGFGHDRAGDVVLVAEADRWFAPDWWRNPAEAPRRLEGSCGLARSTPQGRIDPAHVRGSLGAPPPSPEYHGVLVSSDPNLLRGLSHLALVDLAGLLIGGP